MCFAASWESGSCNLCQETLEGRTLEVQAGPADYVYYYPVSPGAVASRTASSTTSLATNLGGASTIAPALTTPTMEAITRTLTSLPLAPQPTATSDGNASAVQAATFITASAPSSLEVVIEITLTVTELEVAASMTSGAPTT